MKIESITHMEYDGQLFYLVNYGNGMAFMQRRGLRTGSEDPISGYEELFLAALDYAMAGVTEQKGGE